MDDETTNCKTYSPTLHDTAQVAVDNYLSSERGQTSKSQYLFAGLNKKNTPEHEDEATYVPVAYRTGLSLTFVNQYETEVPMKGMTKIIAGTCEYELKIVFPNWENTTVGTCSAKLFLNNDTGKWEFLEWSFKDPNIILHNL